MANKNSAVLIIDLVGERSQLAMPRKGDVIFLNSYASTLPGETLLPAFGEHIDSNGQPCQLLILVNLRDYSIRVVFLHRGEAITFDPVTNKLDCYDWNTADVQSAVEGLRKKSDEMHAMEQKPATKNKLH